MKRLVQTLGFFGRAMRYEGSPSQLAWGVALGIAIGLIPKGNLVMVGLLLALFSLRVNIASGLVAALLTSTVGFLCDPIFHLVGLEILRIPSLESVYTSLASSRWAPWTSFNNTVVMGALFVAACQLLPTYFLFKYLFAKHRPNWAVDAPSTGFARQHVATSWRVG